MKKNIIFVILFASLSLPALAQQQEKESQISNEFSLGYGFIPMTSIDGQPAGFYRWIDKVGAICGSYTYFFNEVVGVGGTYCFDPREIDYTFHNSTINNPRVCNLYESSHTLMGHLKLNCINMKHFVLYTKFGAGISVWGYRLKEFQPELFEVTLPDQHCCFAWQAALGIEVGNERLAGFMQCGLGMEGFLSIGIRFKFKN